MNNRKKEILGLEPKRKSIRKRKTARKEVPDYNDAGFQEWAAWKDECADALGKVRMKRPAVAAKPNAARIAKLRKIVAERALKAEIRLQKKVKRALNAGHREKVKLLIKQRKERLANGIV